MLAVEIFEDAILVSQHRSRLFPERRGAADRRRQLPIDLRARLYFLACREIVENFAEAFGGQVFVEVVVDLRHRCIDAGAQALDLDPGEFAVLGDLALVADALTADFLKIVRATQAAWCRTAQLHVEFADLPEVEHCVKRRHVERANVCHAEEVCDMTNRCFRQPTAMLLLSPPQQRNDCRLLSPLRIFRDLFLGPRKVLLAEGEVSRLNFGRSKAADAHRSTSPNTISIEPRMADTSASMWPRVRKSIACKCAKPGARILHLYGLLVPSATR